MAPWGISQHLNTLLWNGIEMLDRARTGAFSTAEVHGLGILSIPAIFVSQEQQTPSEQHTFCGVAKFCVVQVLRLQPQGRHCPAGPITYSKQHSWRVEKKSHGIYFHHTTSISGIHTVVQWHIQTYDWDSVTLKPEHPVPVHFCQLLFSVGTQKFPPPVVQSTLQAQWVNRSTDNVHRASVVKKSRSVRFYSHAQT